MTYIQLCLKKSTHKYNDFEFYKASARLNFKDKASKIAIIFLNKNELGAYTNSSDYYTISENFTQEMFDDKEYLKSILEIYVYKNKSYYIRLKTQ